MTKEESDSLYKGKYFYECVDAGHIGGELFGPYDDIFYKDPVGTGFVRVVDGNIVKEYTHDEILVTDKKLSFVIKSEIRDVEDCSSPVSYCNDCSCGKKARLEGE